MIDESAPPPGPPGGPSDPRAEADGAPPVFDGRWSSERPVRWWWALPGTAVCGGVLLVGPASWRPAVLAPLLFTLLFLLIVLVTTRSGTTEVDEDGIVVTDRSGAVTAVPWGEVAGVAPPRWWHLARVLRADRSSVPLPGVGRLGAASLADLRRHGAAVTSRPVGPDRSALIGRSGQPRPAPDRGHERT